MTKTIPRELYDRACTYYGEAKERLRSFHSACEIVAASLEAVTAAAVIDFINDDEALDDLCILHGITVEDAPEEAKQLKFCTKVRHADFGNMVGIIVSEAADERGEWRVAWPDDIYISSYPADELEVVEPQ
jgi:hypothetical protein